METILFAIAIIIFVVLSFLFLGWCATDSEWIEFLKLSNKRDREESLTKEEKARLNELGNRRIYRD